MPRQARKVAARWAYQTAMAGWNPTIPQEAFEYFSKTAYLPNTPDLQALDEARDSVNVFLPKLLEMMRQKQGDRYYMNASESRGKIFYFFSPRQPIDSFSLTLGIRGEKALMSFGFIPYRLDGTMDFKRMVSEVTSAAPELAGMALMRLVRSVMGKL